MNLRCATPSGAMVVSAAAAAAMGTKVAARWWMMGAVRRAAGRGRIGVCVKRNEAKCGVKDCLVCYFEVGCGESG